MINFELIMYSTQYKKHYKCPTKKNISHMLKSSICSMCSLCSQYCNRNKNEVSKCILIVVDNIPLKHQEREHRCWRSLSPIKHFGQVKESVWLKY